MKPHKPPVFYYAWTITLIVAASLLSSCQKDRSQQPEASQGILDLRAWDFAKDGPVQILRGEWFLEKGSLLTRPSQTATLLNLPVFMKDQDVRYQTIYTKIRLPEGEHNFWLKISPWTGGAIRVVVFDAIESMPLLSYSKGKLSTSSAAEETMSLRKTPLEFSSTSNEIHLFVQMSHQMFDFVDLNYEILLDGSQHLAKEHYRSDLFAKLVAGFFLLAGMFNLVIAVQTRQQVSLWIGIFSLVQFVRYFTTENLWYQLFWIDLPSRIYFVAMPTIFQICSLALPFLAIAIFRSTRRPITQRTIALSCSCILLTPALFYTTMDLLMFFWSIGLYIFIYCVCGIVLGIQSLRGTEYSRLYRGINWLSFTLPSYSLAHDALVSQGLLASIYINHWMIILFVVLQSILAGQRYAKAFSENKQLLRQIREQEQARTTFFHNTSHELRTPLNGIIGFLELMEQGRYGQAPLPMQQQLGKIKRLAISLKNQVNLILDLAKSKRGELILRNERIDLNDLCNDIELLANGLQLRHTKAQFSLFTSWNRAQENAYFVHDRDQLMSLCRNLLGNAFKFCRSDRPNHVKLSFDIAADESELQLVVEDQGIGIATDQQSVIFTEFKQIQDDARRAYEGTGLGLAMVQNIVNLSKGRLQLSSELDIGTRFAIQLPAQRQVSVEQSLNHSSHDIGQHASATLEAAPEQKPVKLPAPKTALLDSKLWQPSEKTILVVDDNEINCEVVRDILSGFGYNIELAGGGRAALQYLAHHHPDLVILDLMMPEVSGEDVLEAIRMDAALSDIPVILLTARATEDDRIFGLQLGADDYLAKPIIADELILRVYNLLSRISLTRYAEHAESREKMALMGELLSELSHEIKNVNALTLTDKSHSVQAIEMIWSSLGLPATADHQRISRVNYHSNLQERLDQLPVPRASKPEIKRALNQIRIILASSSLNPLELDQIWAELQSFGEAQLLLCAAMITLAANVIRMSESSKRTYQLIAIILKYGQEPAPHECCNLASAVDEALNLLQSRCYKFGIQIKVSISADQEVKISSIELGQIILNLVHNAIDAYTVDPTTQGQRTIIIESIADEKNTVRLLVKNQGSIDATVRQNLFKRGVTSKGANGSGLGLFISKRIAQRAHGDLSLRDDEPNATCFELSLEKSAA